jgi:hypothetical protein
VPWWALLALGLLVAGVVLVAIKGPAAAAAADDLMAQVQSDTSTGFPQYMSVYSGSMWATVGVGGAVGAFLVLGAWVHLDQRLRRAGKYAQAKGGMQSCRLGGLPCHVMYCLPVCPPAGSKFRSGVSQAMSRGHLEMEQQWAHAPVPSPPPRTPTHLQHAAPLVNTRMILAGSYGPMTFKFCSLLGWLGVVLVALLALWMALVAVMLACWTVQCWNLEQGAVVASANIAALEAATASQDKSLQDLGKAVMVAAGGSGERGGVGWDSVLLLGVVAHQVSQSSHRSWLLLSCPTVQRP